MGGQCLAWKAFWAMEDCISTHKQYHVFASLHPLLGLPAQLSSRESACQCRRLRRYGLDTWVRKIPWRRAWQSTPIFLLRESCRQRSLAGCSSQDHRESDMTACLSMHISFTEEMVGPWDMTKGTKGKQGNWIVPRGSRFSILTWDRTESICDMDKNKKYNQGHQIYNEALDTWKYVSLIWSN